MKKGRKGLEKHFKEQAEEETGDVLIMVKKSCEKQVNTEQELIRKRQLDKANEEAQGTDISTCMICKVHPPSKQLKCGHTVFCDNCYRDQISKRPINFCPICTRFKSQ